jgi:uncharacterized membrane protein YphA (DoxX/SURF4 family)
VEDNDNETSTEGARMIQKLWAWVLHPPVTGPRATMVLRSMAGAVFFWEGILKFVYVNQGVGRFTKLGMPMPETLAPAIAVLEIVGGLALIAGFLTRPFALLFIGEMIVAILSTKISMYLGTSPLPLPPVPPQGWHLGRLARGPLGVRADHELHLSPDLGAGSLVARRVASVQ